MAIIEAIRMSLHDDDVVVSVLIDDTDGRPQTVVMSNFTAINYGIVLVNNQGGQIVVEIPPGSNGIQQSVPANVRNRIDMRDPDLFVINPSLRDWTMSLSPV